MKWKKKPAPALPALPDYLKLHRLASNDIRTRHPDANEWEIKLRLASRWLPAKLMREAFGWDPEKEGY